MERKGYLKSGKDKDLELEDAKERLIFNPLTKIFDFRKKCVTDMKGNSEIVLESEMEMIKNSLIETF